MMSAVTLFTIGFTKKNARVFFTTLRQSRIRRLIDIRLNNVSQLAGFTKRDDLAYFLQEICNAEYVHMPACAPSQALLDEFRNDVGGWNRYVSGFMPLIESRRIEGLFERESLDRACLLCSEATPERCHRRLVAEYLARKLGSIEIVHL